MKKILILVSTTLLSACSYLYDTDYSRRVSRVFAPEEVLVLQGANGKNVTKATSSGSGTVGTAGSSADQIKYSPLATDSAKDQKKKSVDRSVDPVTEEMLINMLNQAAVLSSVDGSQNTFTDPSTNLEIAITRFYERCRPKDNTQTSSVALYSGVCKLTRNRIQDRIIFASNSACRIYKNNLKEFHATENTLFGSVTTILGGVGAMTTAATPARILAGGASISAGMNSQLNQNVYSTLAVEIITKAIDKAREDQLAAIQKSRESDAENYTIERAIGDADLYHSRCSLLSGLQEASTSVSKAGSPSTSELNDILKGLNQSVTLKLGQSTAEVFTRQPLLASAVCRDASIRFNKALQPHSVEDQKEYKNAWSKIYDNDCKDFDKSDSIYFDAYQKYATNTDEFSRQNYVVIATNWQKKIQNLNALLEARIREISPASNN